MVINQIRLMANRPKSQPSKNPKTAKPTRTLKTTKTKPPAKAKDKKITALESVAILPAQQEQLPPKNSRPGLDKNKIREAVLAELNGATQKTSLMESMQKAEKILRPRTGLKNLYQKTSQKLQIKTAVLKNNVGVAIKSEEKNQPSIIITVKAWHSMFRPLRKPILMALAGLIIVFFITTGAVYFGFLGESFAKAMANIMPYPAMYVNGQPVLMSDYFSDKEAMAKNLSRQDLPYEEKELARSVIRAILEKTVLQSLAKNEGLSVEAEELNSQINDFILMSGGEQQADKSLNELYGWNIEQFKNKVVSPLILSGKLEFVFLEKNGRSAKLAMLQQKLSEIKEDEDKFYEIASEINEDSTKASQGDLGWTTIGESSPEFESIILNLKAGETSPVIETSYGYQIVRLEETSRMEEGKLAYHVSQIFLKKPAFDDYLQEQISKARVINLIK